MDETYKEFNMIYSNSIILNYLRDTKDLLQPVYEFVTNGNGIIYVPAIH